MLQQQRARALTSRARFRAARRRGYAEKKTLLVAAASMATRRAQQSGPEAAFVAPFALRVNARRRRWLLSAVSKNAAVWRAISVRRQRKLRMKKHKFKKLLRRQKNEKRRQDRL